MTSRLEDAMTAVELLKSVSDQQAAQLLQLIRRVEDPVAVLVSLKRRLDTNFPFQAGEGASLPE